MDKKNTELANLIGSDVQVPWLALLVFTADELQTLPSLDPPIKLSSTLAAAVSGKQLFPAQIMESKLKLRVPFKQADLEIDENINVIFVNSHSFNAYFPAQVRGEKTPAVGRYAYLSPVRRSGTQAFSVILGHRHGPPDITEPTLAFAHLVSLVGVQANLIYEH